MAESDWDVRLNAILDSRTKQFAFALADGLKEAGVNVPIYVDAPSKYVEDEG